MATDHEKSNSNVESWFYKPSDIVIEVDDESLHLHKVPLISRSRQIQLLITEEQGKFGISLPEFPGGSKTFELVAKFCYGLNIEISSSNVAPLRCAAEYLEMTEEYSEGNLIFETERFLIESVFQEPGECLKTLESCKYVMQMAEKIGIIQRCIDVIAEIAWNDERFFCDGNEIRNRQRNNTRNIVIRKTKYWMEELAHLSLPLFRRLVHAMKTREVSSDIIQRSLICYVKISIPSLSAPCRSKKQFSLTPSSNASTAEQKEVFEFIVTNLPLEKRSNSSPGLLKFLFRLLEIVNILNASEACRTILEKKIGSQLEHATLDDLLIHSNSADVNESSTLYDIDCVSRILRYFVEGLDKTMMRSMMLVGKLMDDYLAHIASDENLKPNKFYKLAVALPVQARRFHDGLYRAVDVYFKAHSWLSEEEREKMFMVMDCQKLTVEACTLAAQNYRLPSRALVVLFSQQLQALYAIPEPSLRAAANGDIQSPHLDSTRRRHSHLHSKFQHQQ